VQLTLKDKKRLWKDVVNSTAEWIEPGLFFILLNRCYLDSLEGGKALIVAATETFQRMIEKNTLKALKAGFQEEKSPVLEIQVMTRPRRIIESGQNNLLSTDDTADAKKTALKELHEAYGDIMGIVDNHPVFKKACLPLVQGGWGIFPQLLTNACKDYGVITILYGLRYVSSRPGVKNPRAYFFDRLKRGEFGDKLVIGAELLGTY
jgi:hypothetical protein